MYNPGVHTYAEQKSQKLQMIVFGEDWGAHPSSTQHFIKYLMQKHQILWVNSLGLRRPKLNTGDIIRAKNKLFKMFGQDISSSSASTQYPLPLVNPKSISWPGNPLVSVINRHSLGRQITSEICNHQLSDPIIWTSLPSAIDAIDNFQNSKVVYYCGDDFSALAGVDHKAVAKMENRLVERADLIITAGKSLSGRFPRHKTVTVKHGVDYTLFSNLVSKADDFPTHPLTAGFYGSIHEWLDQDLIAETAVQCPEWQFLFIGKIHTDISKLENFSNIKFIGPRPHNSLPSYVQHWDISLLPFKDCEQIRACNPLKLREYLSAGKPVASTHFPSLIPYRNRVLSMGSSDDLVRILNSLKRSKPVRTPDTSMKNEDWEHQASVIEQHLLSL